MTQLEHASKGVIAIAANKRVVTSATREVIVTGQSVDRVIRRAANQAIGVGGTQ
ncbi:hypothetical protein D3C77_808530 [compost metagenome]